MKKLFISVLLTLLFFSCKSNGKWVVDEKQELPSVTKVEYIPVYHFPDNNFYHAVNDTFCKETPVLRFYKAAWSIKIVSYNNYGKDTSKTLYITESEYNTVKIGDYWETKRTDRGKRDFYKELKK